MQDIVAGGRGQGVAVTVQLLVHNRQRGVWEGVEGLAQEDKEPIRYEVDAKVNVSMQRGSVMTKKSVQSVMNERVLLSQVHSPFLVNMHFAFQDRDTLYLVLDLMEGGDLRYHIGNRIFTEIQASMVVFM